jgi:hypothetical protein
MPPGAGDAIGYTMVGKSLCLRQWRVEVMVTGAFIDENDGRRIERKNATQPSGSVRG